MKKMNTKQIEEVARLHLTNYYVDCGDRLDIKCASNDKTMSYDGSITLFDENENNEELSKKKYRIQIPIQLKGKSVEKFKYKNFKYSVTIEDLKIYSKDFKGILFLVVQICKKEQKLFYNILSPYKVRKILEKGQGQKTISLEFAYAGDDKKRLISICEEFECRVKKEIKASYIKMKDIKDTYPVQFTVSSMTSIFQIFKEIKNYDTPFYVTKNGQNYIIEDLDKIDSLTQYDNNRVFLNGELLWDCVKKEIDQNNNYKLYFGENVILDLTNDKVNNNTVLYDIL